MTTKCKLSDVATWERAKKGKVYPAGCTLLQVSATKGQTVYLHEAREVDAKYCVIIPDTEKVDPFYFCRIVQLGMPEFLSREQTGLNIKPDILRRFPVEYHNDRKLQEYISAEQYFYEMQQIRVEREIAALEEIKRWYLNKLFC